VAVQSSERALVPVPRERSGAPTAADDLTDLARLLAAAAVGIAVEAQRRSLGAAVAVVARLGAPLGIVVRPAVAVARHHLGLDGWAARGLAEQRRAQEAAARAVRALIPTLAAAVLDEIDLDDVVARVDLDRIIERIDLDAIAARIDLDAVVARVDIDAIVGRVDLPALTEQVIDEVDLGEIIRESSSTMASETVDALRVQGMRADGLVSRMVDRILLRQGTRQTGLLPDEPPP
jgi:hypothetical protein